MLLGMTLNAASDFESTGTIKPSGIVLQDGSIIFAVDGTTRTVGSAAAATARLTITDTSATFAGDVTIGNSLFIPDGTTPSFPLTTNGTIFHTAANGLIMAGQGTSTDFLLGNSAGANVLSVPTNTNSAIFAGRFVTGGGTPQTYDYIYQSTAGVADPTLVILDGVGANVAFFGASGGGYNAAACTLRIGRNDTTGRTINAGGTINASGADFAEYRELIPALYNNTSAGRFVRVQLGRATY
jgi:hypothetical protein